MNNQILNHIIEVENHELAHHHQLSKVFYISNLMKTSPLFDQGLRQLLKEAVERGDNMPQMTTISEMSKHEKADIFNPIQKTNTYNEQRRTKSKGNKRD